MSLIVTAGGRAPRPSAAPADSGSGGDVLLKSLPTRLEHPVGGDRARALQADAERVGDLAVAGAGGPRLHHGAAPVVLGQAQIGARAPERVLHRADPGLGFTEAAARAPDVVVRGHARGRQTVTGLTLTGDNVPGIRRDHHDTPLPMGPEARARWEALEHPSLSGREREILLLAARGFSNAGIARRLGLSPETVKSHLRQVMGKLGARNRSHAVALAYEFGLVPPGALWEGSRRERAG